MIFPMTGQERKGWPLNTGNCLINVITCTGMTVFLMNLNIYLLYPIQPLNLFSKPWDLALCDTRKPCMADKNLDNMSPWKITTWTSVTSVFFLWKLINASNKCSATFSMEVPLIPAPVKTYIYFYNSFIPFYYFIYLFVIRKKDKASNK
jgi:hypothetical protein